MLSFASENDEKKISNQASPAAEPANGASWLTPEESMVQYEELKKAEAQLEIVDNETNLRASAKVDYDIETNPILIGNWNKNDCGKNSWTTYARHTLGTKSKVGSQKYLTSHGRATWYNTSDLKALPYRNGSSTIAEHKNVVDVNMGIFFAIRDLSTDTAYDVYRNDFGPNQCPNSETLRSTIVDL